MRRVPLLVAAAALAAAATTLLIPSGAAAQPAAAQPAAAPPAGPTVVRACSVARAGFAACLAQVRTDITAGLRAAGVTPDVTPAGLGPAQLQSAYALPSATAGAGQTIAIVDAQDDPTAEADLAVYRAQYGLPACTTANGCFRKVSQTGTTTYPAVDAGWALEISLDLDMVSAICPNCHILLVEATSASLGNLATSVDEAATLHANAISNSYGGSELLAALSGANSHYNHPGIAVTASSGDSGFGVSFPATSQFVTSVGGTTLTTAANARGWTESAWSGSGSGCSSFFARPAAQASAGTGCSRRAVADVSAVADPATGVAVYDSTPFQGQSGWFVVGGTSASSPIIASVYGLAGNASSVSNAFPYSHTASLFDVTTGSNGTCTTTQQCTARVGWDGPTGLGTPNGTGAF